MKRSQNTLNSKKNPRRFSTSLTTNSQIIRLIMAKIVSRFKGTPSSNRIEVTGKEISLAIIKTRTDWATELVCQNLSLTYSVYPVPVLSMQEKVLHDLVKYLFPMKIYPGLPLAGRVKDFAKEWEKLTKDPAVLKLHKHQIPFVDRITL